MTRWEYMSVTLQDGYSFLAGYNCECKTTEERTGREHMKHEHIWKNLDDLGAEGWELVGVDDGRAYFKRAKAE